MEISNLLDEVFEVMYLNMLAGLERRMDELIKSIRDKKNKESIRYEVNKNTLEDAQEWISNLEELGSFHYQKKKRIKNWG